MNEKTRKLMKYLYYSIRENDLLHATLIIQQLKKEKDSGVDMSFGFLFGEGNTILHYVCNIGLIELIPPLLDLGMNINAKNFFGNTPLFNASLDDRTDVVRVLLKYNPDVHAKNTLGQTALHVASPNVEIIKLLLAAGADPNRLDGMGHVPLTYAVWNNDVEGVKTLLNAGADPIVDKEIFDHVGKSNNSIMLQMLEDWGKRQ